MTTRAAKARITTRLFDSLDVLADYAAAATYKPSDPKWAGATLPEALRLTRDGDARLVARSDELLRRYEALAFPTTRRQWRNDVAGYFPNVPAHIAGVPTSMRRRERRENVIAPITVYVDLFLSAMFDAEAAMARGAAILALTRVLTAHRAVTLYVGYGTTTHDGHTLCPMVQINTTPLDLAHAAYVMCSTSFVRQTLLRVMDRMVPGSSPWPVLRGDVRDVIAAGLPHTQGTQVLVIPGGIVGGIVRDPSKWIEERIREAATDEAA